MALLPRVTSVSPHSTISSASNRKVQVDQQATSQSEHLEKAQVEGLAPFHSGARANSSPDSSANHRSVSFVAQPTALIQQALARYQQLQFQVENARQQQAVLLQECRSNQKLLDGLEGKLGSANKEILNSFFLHSQKLKIEQTQMQQNLSGNQEQIKRIRQNIDDSYIWMSEMYQKLKLSLHEIAGVSPHEQSGKKIDKSVANCHSAIRKLKEERGKSSPNARHIAKYQRYIDNLISNFCKLMQRQDYSVILSKVFY